MVVIVIQLIWFVDIINHMNEIRRKNHTHKLHSNAIVSKTNTQFDNIAPNIDTILSNFTIFMHERGKPRHIFFRVFVFFLSHAENVFLSFLFRFGFCVDDYHVYSRFWYRHVSHIQYCWRLATQTTWLHSNRSLFVYEFCYCLFAVFALSLFTLFSHFILQQDTIQLFSIELWKKFRIKNGYYAANSVNLVQNVSDSRLTARVVFCSTL